MIIVIFFFLPYRQKKQILSHVENAKITRINEMVQVKSMIKAFGFTCKKIAMKWLKTNYTLHAKT